MTIEIVVFDVWEIPLIGPFSMSGQNSYIVTDVDYVSQ